ncbi:MAG: protein jag, partial [Clostridia bacterium]|nr:protein jag [Clostridia bacterium]
MEENVFTGKTVDDAVDAGLKALGITLADAEIEVLEEGKKKLFGSVKAKVKITVKQSDEEPVMKVSSKTEDEDKPIFKAVASAEEPAAPAAAAEAEAPAAEEGEDTSASDAARAAEFINGLLPLLHIEGEAKVLPENEDGSIAITINTTATYKVIGKRGDVLDSIQCIAGAIANIGRDKYKKVVVDCENYRETRKESLERLAHKLEKKATETGRKIILEPMNPYERRIIHSALTDSPDVTTMSEGKEPNRYVVVIPSNAKPYDKGIRYSSAHNGSSHGGHGGPSHSAPRGGSRGNFNRDRDR